MAILCRNHNLLFIMTPRTGCTAIGEMLCNELGGEYLPAEDILNDEGNIVVQKKHSTVRQLLDCDLLDRATCDSLLKFTAVRNPFDSFVSLYVKKSSRSEELLGDPESFVHRMPQYKEDVYYCATHSFDEWIANRFAVSRLERLFRKGRRSLFDRYTEGVDCVMRFENLQEDFDRLLHQAGVGKKLDIPRINPTTSRNDNYREYYSPESRAIIEYAFASDLKKYGYAF